MKINKLKEFISQKLKNELSDKLTYHGLHHTLLVLKICNEYIERMKISDSEAKLLQTAAIMHDTGFLWDNENHEERSILYSKEILPDWNYSDEEIEKIASLIRATKIPQKPTNTLEQIIGDSDLDYLGTDLFYEEGEKLYQELLSFNKISTREEWDKLQVKFLENHTYHTPFAKLNREPVKQKHLWEIKEKWGW